MPAVSQIAKRRYGQDNRSEPPNTALEPTRGSAPGWPRVCGFSVAGFIVFLVRVAQLTSEVIRQEVF